MATKRKATASSQKKEKEKKRQQVVEEGVKSEGAEVEQQTPPKSPNPASSIPKKAKRLVGKKEPALDEDCKFTSQPVADDEARQRWPHRYQNPGKGKTMKIPQTVEDDDDIMIPAKRHYTKASVDGHVYNLEDDAHVKSEDENEHYICKIVEMFEAVDGKQYFTAQWFYRAKDTVLKSCGNLIDDKRVFFSEVKNDNPLDCLVEILSIVPLPANVTPDFKQRAISSCDYYYDMTYLLPYSTFLSLPSDNSRAGSESDSTISSEEDSSGTTVAGDVSRNACHQEIKLLDLYSGCGAMSTGLCLGANSSGVKLVTKWAVDLNEHACNSLKLNHPETEVRNESAEDFLAMLREWQKICDSYGLTSCSSPLEDTSPEIMDAEASDTNEGNDSEKDEGDDEVYEVEKILAVCFGDPANLKKRAVYFKVRWKGYGPDDDTWEPKENLSDCPEKLKEFISAGYKSKILPLPGDVDVVCGGPPCQGISGFNRFRNKENPLEDEKNKQLLVYMDIVDFLKPRFVLMENVVDIVKFSSGFLGRYALGRLVGMNYQARLGMMAAGTYGLPQFRMRVFMWGALPTEKLPQYPLPTHHVVVRGVIPTEFESNTVAYEEGHNVQLEKELFLGDAISDLPPVENDEARDEMPYNQDPETEFQQFIRLQRDEMPGCLDFGKCSSRHVLYDHRPLKLNQDDYQRVCEIPKRKGANFRDLKGVRVRADNKVEWDPDVERVYLPSGKPLVPDYAMTFVGGSSSKPFGRLWWDETVPTVVTRAEPHNQTILHPVQDRVLTIRENARLQGFPDYYKLTGPIKERYIQVGNAVAVPVARALGYSLALALRKLSGDNPLLTLPKDFPKIAELVDSDVNE